MTTKQPNTMQNEKKKDEAFSQIGTKSFLVVVALLCAILALCGVLSNFVPQGAYQRDDLGMIISGTYVKGAVKGIAFWRVITAPFRVFASEDGLTVIMISVFLLVMSGVFNLLEKTGGVRVVIGKAVKKFSGKKRLLVFFVTLVFMAFGSFFGMFEELVTLLPLVIVLMLSMGFDTLTGLGVCMMSACFGFSAAITNPFSVGIVADLADTHVFNGAWLRVLFFLFVYGAVCLFLTLHIKKIEKNPARSYTYEIDQRKLQALGQAGSEETQNEGKIFKTFITFFALQLVVLMLVAAIRPISGFAIPILAASFLIGGIVAGLCVCPKKSDVFLHLLKGAVAMLPAVVMIALASSVKLVMVESGIMDTVMHEVIEALEGKNKFLCILLIYLLILFLQIFIGSSSAKIMLIMPIMLPIAQSLGISTPVIILTYCIADGFTDVILPTNPVLLVGLSMANVSYGTWVKWTWKFQLVLFAATVALLMLAVQIGY